MNMAILLGILACLSVTLPLAWKWQLGVRRVAVFVAIIAAAVSLILELFVPSLSSVGTTLVVAGATLSVSTLYLAYRFYRDPERTAPAPDGVVVSPADGLVVYVKRSEQGQVPISTKHGHHCPLSELLKTPFYSSDAWVIGISMSLLDVHVNRAPITGRISFQKHFPGKFGSLRRAENLFENERATAIIDGGHIQVAIVQIASRLVRQIVSYVKLDQSVALGQRIGAIRLGSQVDVVLPVRGDLRVAVSVGQTIKAGESILATFDATTAVDGEGRGLTTARV
jgi:phosphatidylserine decarboxylase